ncbi:MAG: hypothetical protein QM626_13400 [Microbacterium sp.]|uniref:hypothetical protein n=1 Tax=Microbacterium sp. TaxID=51671 RepID=UPI0039E66388
MTLRVGTAAAGIVLAAALLAGCVPDPDPTPSATGFADEDAAFAAAEATYRAYVDALNQVDLSDPATFEEVYRWTTGDALSQEKESLSTMHADGWIVSGASSVIAFRSVAVDLVTGDGNALACVDVSAVTLVDANGASQVSADRPDIQTVTVAFEFSSTSPTLALLTSLEGAAEDVACD